jgi:sugar/nucleoside kinase (ribokinase family)
MESIQHCRRNVAIGVGLGKKHQGNSIMRKKIIGIGNALMDVVVQLPDNALLGECNLPKGAMIMVDQNTSVNISQKTAHFNRVVAPGGSVANTISGLANLGAASAFIGKVGNDEMGKLYHHELKKIGSNPILFQTETPTGIAMALGTPDGERTFGTYLGAAVELSPAELSATLFNGYDIAYIEGYLVQNHDLARKAASLCKASGMTVAIDLASYNVVAENKDFLDEIIGQYIDIVFANEDEAKAFTGKEPEEAVSVLSKKAGLAIVKIGKEGSLIQQRGERMIHTGIENSFLCIDTTGAGDLYAAGFLHAYASANCLNTCGKAGAIVAGYVVSVYGARMDAQMWSKINKELSEFVQ